MTPPQKDLDPMKELNRKMKLMMNYLMLGLAVYLIIKGRARGDVEPAPTV